MKSLLNLGDQPSMQSEYPAGSLYAKADNIEHTDAFSASAAAAFFECVQRAGMAHSACSGPRCAALFAREA
ncbi:hypothetical protein [Stutzerimonas stutzeri]|uniref:hypothetical protein n=1 Tax=Stutzerimonas stutzeri TaxID=316 RepID=UPI003721FC31